MVLKDFNALQYLPKHPRSNKSCLSIVFVFSMVSGCGPGTKVLLIVLWEVVDYKRRFVYINLMLTLPRPIWRRHLGRARQNGCCLHKSVTIACCVGFDVLRRVAPASAYNKHNRSADRGSKTTWLMLREALWWWWWCAFPSYLFAFSMGLDDFNAFQHFPKYPRITTPHFPQYIIVGWMVLQVFNAFQYFRQHTRINKPCYP